MKTLSIQVSEEEYAAVLLLRKMQENPIEIASLIYDAWLRNRKCLSRVRHSVHSGIAAMQQESQTVSFRRAVEVAIEKRANRRKRTIWDFRYICRRMMSRNPGLADRRIRSLDSGDCENLLNQAFTTDSQFRKGRSVLSCVFATALRLGWCAKNPVTSIGAPSIREKTIFPLTHDEINRLWAAARLPQHRDMQLSLYLLLYCGLRPNEVSRLNPDAVDIEQRCVRVCSNCSKTGGGRVVPLRKLRLLQSVPPCIPKSWIVRWRELRRSAGFSSWQRDVCRHTFASYHAAYFRNLSELQWEMGHCNGYLLKSRYLYPIGVRQPEKYWRDI